MDFDYFLCEFEEKTHMIFLESSSDARQTVIQEFQIHLSEGEDLNFREETLQALVQPKDIFKLITSAKSRNMNLKILCQKTHEDQHKTIGQSTTTHSENIEIQSPSIESLCDHLEPEVFLNQFEVDPVDCIIEEACFDLETEKGLRAFINFSNPGLITCSDGGLSETDRNKLSRDIIQQMLNGDHERMLKNEEYFSLANHILAIFPKELLATYFIPYGINSTCKSTASGKLHSAFRNYRKHLISKGVVTPRPKKRKRSETEPPLRNLDVEPDPSLGSALQLLKTAVNVDDENVIRAWNVTREFRFAELDNKKIPTIEIIEKYPILTQPRAHKLVVSDFEVKFDTTLQFNFPEGFSNLVINNLSRAQKKTACVKSVIETIQLHDDDTSYKNILSLHLLAYFFKCATDSEGRKLTKVEMADHLLQIKENFSEIKTFNQPSIAVVGYPAIFVLSVAGQNIHFRDISEGLRCFFAYHFALNISYLQENIIPWNFIQKHIFGITSRYDEGASNETLARDLGLI